MLLFSVSDVYGQQTKIANAYQQFVNSGKLPNGMASLTVLDGKTGQLIFEQHGSIGLPTASTLKVVTAATALDILGAGYTFKTELAYTGVVDSAGVLHGDVIIKGSGDPTLGSDRFAETKEENILNKWLYAISAAGIKHINGRVIGDDLHWNGNDMPGGWSWADMGNYYGAGVSGLNWRENKAGVVFTPWHVGQPATVDRMVPALAGVTMVNEVLVGPNGSGDNVYAYSAPYSDVIYLRGTYGRDLKKTIEISVPNPALDAAHQLHQALLSHDIWVDSIPTTGKLLSNAGSYLPKERVKLDVHVSPALKDIVHWFNQKSINLYGEALLKTVGMISGNKPGTDDATLLVAKYWEQKLKIPTSEIRMMDGSGLSAQTRVTTNAIAKIMHYAQGRPWFADFQKSLPNINGMAMKSGTIGGVLGYTGYHVDKQGQAYTFSLIVNNYTGGSSSMRQAMFKLLDNLK